MYMLFFTFGPKVMTVGPRENRLLPANPWFVRGIEVQRLSEGYPESTTLLGFRSTPALSRHVGWMEDYSGTGNSMEVLTEYKDDVSTAIVTDLQKTWMIWLNRGSHMTIHLRLPGLTSGMTVFGVIQGADRAKKWQQQPHIFDDYIMVHEAKGDDSISFAAVASAEFYVVLFHAVDGGSAFEYSMTFSVDSALYSLSGADSRCSMPPSKTCALDLGTWDWNVAMLVTNEEVLSASVLATERAQWRVAVYYHTRWSAYLWLIGITWFASYLVSAMVKRRAITAAAQQYHIIASSGPFVPSAFLASAPHPGLGLPPSQVPFLPPAPRPASQDWFANWSWRNSGSAEQVSGPSISIVEEARRSVDSPPFVTPCPSSSFTAEASADAERGREEHQQGQEGPSAFEQLARDPNDGFEQAEGTDRACAVCLDAKKDAILLECGHLVTCYSCGMSLLSTRPSCPVCRKRISRVVKVYDV
eukprot:TRINITY_DN6042_c0_g1_i4.p1 TRINITY_DN6042_c0_g1~~TRINITY_DN6042_c0_g1_i4.p1  ORF type:complete len:472 (+),score=75.55 TRINITY_DN6042_c0_g1_i4:180-1595(+)